MSRDYLAAQFVHCSSAISDQIRSLQYKDRKRRQKLTAWKDFQKYIPKLQSIIIHEEVGEGSISNDVIEKMNKRKEQIEARYNREIGKLNEQIRSIRKQIIGIPEEYCEKLDFQNNKFRRQIFLKKESMKIEADDPIGIEYQRLKYVLHTNAKKVMNAYNHEIESVNQQIDLNCQKIEAKLKHVKEVECSFVEKLEREKEHAECEYERRKKECLDKIEDLETELGSSEVIEMKRDRIDNLLQQIRLEKEYRKNQLNELEKLSIEKYTNQINELEKLLSISREPPKPAENVKAAYREKVRRIKARHETEMDELNYELGRIEMAKTETLADMPNAIEYRLLEEADYLDLIIENKEKLVEEIKSLLVLPKIDELSFDLSSVETEFKRYEDEFKSQLESEMNARIIESWIAGYESVNEMPCEMLDIVGNSLKLSGANFIGLDELIDEGQDAIRKLNSIDASITHESKLCYLHKLKELKSAYLLTKQAKMRAPIVKYRGIPKIPFFALDYKRRLVEFQEVREQAYTNMSKSKHIEWVESQIAKIDMLKEQVKFMSSVKRGKHN